MTQAKKRTLIYATHVGTHDVSFELPEWRPMYTFELPKAAVPYHERQYLHPGFRCYVNINLDAQTAAELDISDWGL